MRHKVQSSTATPLLQVQRIVIEQQHAATESKKRQKLIPTEAERYRLRGWPTLKRLAG